MKEAQEAKEVKEAREGKEGMEGMEVKVAQRGQRLFPLVGQGLPVGLEDPAGGGQDSDSLQDEDQ